MSDGGFFEIILFAMVAAFLVLRLRSVLGRRTGHERQRDLFRAHRDAKTAASDNVVALPDRDKSERDKGERAREESGATETASVSAGVSAIRAADPSFDLGAFQKGARAAFEMIVSAFAAGDPSALRPLLSPEVFEGFAEAIKTRKAARETLETRLVSIKAAEPVEARLDGRHAVITVRFVSDQINVTRAADGSVVDGDPDHIVERSDNWTFSRDTRARDPNWLLIGTQSA